MPRKAVAGLVDAYRHEPVTLPPGRAQWWGLYDEAEPDARERLLVDTGDAPPGSARIVTWRVPYGVGAIDLRYFVAWRRRHERHPRTVLAVELEGPAGACDPADDERVRLALDEASWVLERLWLAAWEPPTGSRRSGSAALGARREAGAVRSSTIRSAAEESPAPRALLLVRPDGVVAMGTGLAPEHLVALDVAAGKERLIAVDISQVLHPGQELGPRHAEATSRVIERMRSGAVLHAAALRPDEAPYSTGRAKDRRGLRVYRSALHEAALGPYYRGVLRRDFRLESEFAYRHYQLVVMQESLRSGELRERLTAAGLTTV